MAPTVDVDTMTPPSSSVVICRGSASCPSEANQMRFHNGSLCSSSSQDHDNNNCETHICSRDITPSQRYVIPEASPAFRATMGTMKSELTQNVCSNTNTSVDKPTHVSTSSSNSSSLLNKLKSAFKSSSSASSQNSSNHSGKSQSTPSSSSKTGNSRRPASFGGADVIKPWTGRRASQCEKRVSWADERGSAQALFSVRLIKPRLTMGTKRARQSTPGHSILRNTGLH